jgi:hypothetical protein
MKGEEAAFEVRFTLRKPRGHESNVNRQPVKCEVTFTLKKMKDI